MWNLIVLIPIYRLFLTDPDTTRQIRINTFALDESNGNDTNRRNNKTAYLANGLTTLITE